MSKPTTPSTARLTRREYRPGAASFTDLPFVADERSATRAPRRNFWSVPPTDDYGAACNMGRQYACDFAQFLKNNPVWVDANILGRVVEGMAAHPSGSPMHGYEVGFWSALEALLYRSVVRENHWDVIQQVQDRYDAALDDREADEEEEEGRQEHGCANETRRRRFGAARAVHKQMDSHGV